MAIAFDAVASGSFDSTELTFSHTCTGSNLILFVSTGTSAFNDVLTGVTYNGVTMTLANKTFRNSGSGDRYNYLFYLIAPDTGTHDVVCSYSSSGLIRGASATYTGANQSSQPDNTAVNSGTGSSLTGTLTTVADNCWTILGAQSSFADLAAGSGSTQRVSDSLYGIFDSNGVITPAGSTSMTVTATALALSVVMASFSPSTAPATSIKTFNGLAYASSKTINGIAIASVKTWNGLA